MRHTTFALTRTIEVSTLTWREERIETIILVDCEMSNDFLIGIAGKRMLDFRAINYKNLECYEPTKFLRWIFGLCDCHIRVRRTRQLGVCANSIFYIIWRYGRALIRPYTRKSECHGNMNLKRVVAISNRLLRFDSTRTFNWSYNLIWLTLLACARDSCGH